MKRVAVLVAAIAVMLGVMVPTAGAKPPGVDSSVGQLAFTMNIIGTPGEYTGGCGGGARVFIERDSSSRIIFQGSDHFEVVDCNGTGNNTALVDVDRAGGNSGQYAVYIRILGKPGGQLRICSSAIEDPDVVDCLLGLLTLTREGSKSSFQISPKIWDAVYQNVLWSLDANNDFRIAQLRVYEVNPA